MNKNFEIETGNIENDYRQIAAKETKDALGNPEANLESLKKQYKDLENQYEEIMDEAEASKFPKIAQQLLRKAKSVSTQLEEIEKKINMYATKNTAGEDFEAEARKLNRNLHAKQH